MVKNIASIMTLTLTICFILSISFSSNETVDLSKYSTKGLDLNYTVRDNADEEFDLLASNEPFTPYLGKSFVGFKEALAFKESGGDYFSVNTFGYLGKYQFGKETLRMIGIKNSAKFLKNPKLQERAFIANAERNKWILRREIKNFVGKRINGVIVTESGILASAHLAGPGNVKKYLRSYGLDNFADGYGTTVYHYMKRFSGYDTSFVKPNKAAKAI
ncbi:peptidoglycan-binding protein LysM [Flavivirga aquimarina]|uniref:Peptidoglycan-binding protein LysM n=1 Tax=Flavivirga aquimarina TaxID=2027862 RepID=A0ABT8WAY5_9FLAO|nr:peptidoglycan-binding protein LysM [Flavivirga aquimarina]MDO5970211.1 peptidoglycan-binding protein LysM [Flavivirga aquimarina]